MSHDPNGRGSNDIDPEEDPEAFARMERRKMLAALGAGAAGGLAGCGGDSGTPTPTATPTPTDTPMDGDTPTDTPMDGDTPTDTPMDDDTPTDTPAGGGEETDTPGGASRTVHGKTLKHAFDWPLPSDANFQRLAGTNLVPVDTFVNFGLVGQSFYDYQYYPILLEKWESRPGLLTLNFHDDFYFSDGYNIDADAYLLDLELADFYGGEEDLNANPAIVKREKTGDYSVQLALQDTWSEEWALQKSGVTSGFGGQTLNGSPNYYEPWVQKFRDASTQDKIEEIRENLGNQQETNPKPFTYGTFDIAEATSDTYVFKLRTREYLDSNGFDHEIPHFVDEINYDTVELAATSEQWTRMAEEFEKGNLPFGGDENGDYDFETQTFNFVRPHGFGAFWFNPTRSPMSNPHFRRAWAFMVNRKKLSGHQVPDRRVTPYYTPQMEDSWVSDDILDSIADYGFDQAMMGKAEQEMIQGGFVRNSDGNWLFKEGERKGEPMEFTYSSFWDTNHIDTTRFHSQMADLGIDLEYTSAGAGELWVAFFQGDYEICFNYWKSSNRINGLGYVFGEQTPSGGGKADLGPIVKAPPVGDTHNWADARNYEVDSMFDRLKVLQDQEVVQDITDELVWVYNQTVPFLGVYIWSNKVTFNTEYYDIKGPADAPKKWSQYPYRNAWDSGIANWIPESER